MRCSAMPRWQTIGTVFAQMTPCANAESRPQAGVVLGLLAGVARLRAVPRRVKPPGNGGGYGFRGIIHLDSIGSVQSHYNSNAAGKD